MPYTPTVWVDRQTKLGPTNLNKLEQGLSTAAATADAAQTAAAAAASGAIPLTQKGAASGVATLDATSKLVVAQLPLIPVAQLPLGVANGVASLDANAHIPEAQRLTYGTTPPASPNDGDRWILPMDLTNGIMWQFRYRAAAGAFKWEFVGGSPAIHAIVAAENTSSTTFVDLGTVGPTLTLPRAGDYLAEFSVDGYHSAGGQVIIAAVKRGAAATVDLDGASGRPQTPAGDSVQMTRQLYLTGMAAADVVKLQYREAASGTATFRYRTLTVIPIRVS